ncbi:MAG: adenylate/guanylate cyclase domain-containing protein [Desulfuromonadaceae bacterium]
MNDPVKLQRQYRIWTAFFTVLIIMAGLAWYGYLLGLLSWVDHFLYDAGHYWQPAQPPTGQVSLVLMDEPSAQALKRQTGHWSRRDIAQALDNLCAAGAEIIGLDMILSAPDPDPTADEVLAAAMDRCNNVVLARISSAQGMSEIQALDRFQAVSIGDGFIDLPLDSDDVLRKIRFLNAKPLADGNLELLPAFALELARSYLQIDYQFDFSASDFFTLGSDPENQLKLPYPELLTNYGGTSRTLPSLSFVDVVNNRFSPEQVKGKIVILGSSLVAEKDFFTTPITRFSRPTHDATGRFKEVVTYVLAQKELGVACHAHAVETILSGRFIQKAPSWSIVLLIVLCGLLGLFFYASRLGLLAEISLLFLFLLGLLLGAYCCLSPGRLWLDVAHPAAVVFAQFLAGLTLQKNFQRKRTSFITDIFGKYVSPAVVTNLVKGDLSLNMEGQQKEVSILFSDLRNFTAISETLGAQATGHLLNDYFDRMIPLIFQHEGTLDKLMGDAIMAFFGAPLELPTHPQKAAETALAMLAVLDQWQQEYEATIVSPLELGIGINTGDVTVGNLGSRDFMDYTIIGDAVNLASRLEGLNKVYGSRIIIGEQTAAALDERFLLRELDRVRVKGKLVPERIFELLCFRAEADDALLGMVAAFSEGLNHFRRGLWDEARSCFSRAANYVPEDGPTALYLKRIAQFQQEAPGAEWDGVTRYLEK